MSTFPITSVSTVTTFRPARIPPVEPAPTARPLANPNAAGHGRFDWENTRGAAPGAASGTAAGDAGAANSASNGVESRPILWGAVDLGPDHDALGCGGAGSTAVPDRMFGLDLRQACEGHDACSDPLDAASDRPLGDVLACQARFAGDIYRAGGESWLGKVGGAVAAAIYTPVVAAVALAQWAGNRVVAGVRGWFE